MKDILVIKNKPEVWKIVYLVPIYKKVEKQILEIKLTIIVLKSCNSMLQRKLSEVIEYTHLVYKGDPDNIIYLDFSKTSDEIHD